jgi:hypothetical protein
LERNIFDAKLTVQYIDKGKCQHLISNLKVEEEEESGQAGGEREGEGGPHEQQPRQDR